MRCQPGVLHPPPIPTALLQSRHRTTRLMEDRHDRGEGAFYRKRTKASLSAFGK